MSCTSKYDAKLRIFGETRKYLWNYLQKSEIMPAWAAVGVWGSSRYEKSSAFAKSRLQRRSFYV
jgi:hypothetical protein